MLNLSDKSVSDIIRSAMYHVHYVATSGDNLYYTNHRAHKVTCCIWLVQIKFNTMMSNVLLFLYYLLVTSNRKADSLSFTTNSLLDKS
jgi:hypothetical protein